MRTEGRRGQREVITAVCWEPPIAAGSGPRGRLAAIGRGGERDGDRQERCGRGGERDGDRQERDCVSLFFSFLFTLGSQPITCEATDHSLETDPGHPLLLHPTLQNPPLIQHTSIIFFSSLFSTSST